MAGRMVAASCAGVLAAALMLVCLPAWTSALIGVSVSVWCLRTLLGACLTSRR